MARARKQKDERETQGETVASPEPEQAEGVDKIELHVHVDFEQDGRGIHIAPGVVLSNRIPASFLTELIESGKARKL
jgi:hypothetical protein